MPAGATGPYGTVAHAQKGHKPRPKNFTSNSSSMMVMTFELLKANEIKAGRWDGRAAGERRSPMRRQEPKNQLYAMAATNQINLATKTVGGTRSGSMSGLR